ncbi:Uu.00g040900.m01.CDS01 [Anthostomella pinea]|uniref:Uu.00g040900.m01.CDS01 n=1 Tax=Anthostomella pinea TaxID=933095 RepID=A0AAI8VAY5_9PEZI|nr:Uu.00g040900.m01.CDS01 [Anthostomella pinea]
MGRKPVPQPLSLAEGDSAAGALSAGTGTLPSPESIVRGAPDRPSPRPAFSSQTTLQVASPASSKSPKSPRSPFSKFNPARKPQAQREQPLAQTQPVEVHHQPPPLRIADDVHAVQRQRRHPHQNAEHPSVTSPIQQSVTTPTLREAYGHPEEEKHSRSGSRFFNFGKASRSNQHLPHSHTESHSEAMSRGTEYAPVMTDKVSSKTSKNSDQSSVDHSHQKSAPSLPSRSEVSLVSAADHESTSSKRNKPKPFALLGRSRSTKDKDGHSPKDTVTINMPEPESTATHAGQAPLKTAPIHPERNDRAFRHMMSSSARNHSADRAVPRDMSANKENRHDKDYRSHPSSFRDNHGSTFFGGLKSSGSRAADMISKGLFGKGGRSASANEREPTIDDEHYVLKVINRPLVEQTRLTRISKRLEDSRDKTEFWMPAFPWRAIDYLNFNGTDVEGLYRVPGSGPQIKKWQRRFDEEHDVDLFAQDDLYDINIIGSMLKAWLRELPDELFPKAAQDRIARECMGAEEVPQLLIDELSNLSPFNYYLLFAVTCHLSLLLAHSDKNKMDFRNLCICFQPCMKIDAFCFKFLVCDWRLCWQGCKSEARFIEEEYMLFDQPLPRGLSADGRSNFAGESQDDRNISSSDSSKEWASTQETPHNGMLRKKPLATGQPNGNMAPNYASVSASLTVNNELDTRRSGDLRPLSPIKPLSPLGF